MRARPLAAALLVLAASCASPPAAGAPPGITAVELLRRMRGLLQGQRLARRDAPMEALGTGIAPGMVAAPGTAGDAAAGWLAPDGLGQWAHAWDTSGPADGRPADAWTRGARLSLSLGAAPCIRFETAARTFGSVRVSLETPVGGGPQGGLQAEWLEAAAGFRPGACLALAFDDKTAARPCATRATLAQARRIG